jgi:hypothetical protein
MVRRRAERDASVAIASISPHQVVYKGLFVGDELGRFYDDWRWIAKGQPCWRPQRTPHQPFLRFTMVLNFHLRQCRQRPSD